MSPPRDLETGLATVRLPDREEKESGASSARPSTTWWMDAPELGFPVASRTPAGFEQEEEIGRGGMGVVHSAVQLSLAREVALKRLLPAATAGAREALLREARVTSMLEHPGITPVHDLVLDPSAGPVMVMKRIRGEPWTTVIDDPSHPLREKGPRDPLAWHLSILVDVCHAVEFAHGRGILHRDLKPENVMLGPYGEVVVMDWGLAVAFGEGHDPGIGHVDGVMGLEGTPGYLAPEMIRGGRALGPWTDVYLLGAIVHRVVVGQTRHVGACSEKIASALLSEPYSYGEHVPTDLVTILHRCLHVDPARRYGSVAELRRAVEQVVYDLGSSDLVARARACREALEWAQAEADEREVGTRYVECRFALREAIRVRPGDAPLRADLQDTVRSMITWYLERGNDRAASLLLADLPEGDVVVEARVRDAALIREREVEALGRIRADLDLDSGKGARTVLEVGSGGVVVLASGAAFVIDMAGHLTYTWLLGLVGLGLVTVVTAGALSLRHRRNAATWRLWLLLAGGMALLTLFLAASWRLGVPIRSAATLLLLFGVAVEGAAAMLFDRRFAVSAAVFLAAFFAALVSPQLVFAAFVLGVAASLTVAAWVNLGEVRMLG